MIVIWPLPVVFSGCVNYFKGYWLVKLLVQSLCVCVCGCVCVCVFMCIFHEMTEMYG